MDNTISSDYLKLIFFSIAICCLAYGFTLTNFSLSIDSEQTFYSDTSLALGRWGTNLFRYHIFHGIIPYFTLLIALVFFSISAVEMSRLFKLDTVQSYIFCGIMLTFPQMAYQFIFTMQADAVGFGFLLSTLSIILFVKSVNRSFDIKSALYFIVGTLLYMFVIAIYQALVIIPLIIYLMIIYRSTYYIEYSFKTEFRKALLFAGFVILAAILYYASVKVLAPQAGNGGYLSSYTSGSTDNIFMTFLKLWGRHLGGDGFYGEKTFVAATVASLILLLSFLSDKRKFLVRALILAAIVMLPFLISFFITSGYNPPRLYVTSGIALAFLMAQLATVLPAKKVLVALSAFVILVNVYFITILFLSHHKVYNHDITIARNIDNTIRSKYPEYDPSLEYIYFFGSLPYGEHERFRIPESEIFGGSFFVWDGGSNDRIINFIRFAHVADYKMIDKKELYLGVKDSIASMPVWPKPGHIKKMGNVVVVKLGETKGAPLWVE